MEIEVIEIVLAKFKWFRRGLGEIIGFKGLLNEAELTLTIYFLGVVGSSPRLEKYFSLAKSCPRRGRWLPLALMEGMSYMGVNLL